MFCATNNAECKQPDSCAERGCFTDRVRTQHLGVPTKDSTRTVTPPSTMQAPSWEKGVAGEYRPGGGFVPYIGAGKASPMGIKEAAEKRTEIKRIRDRQRNDPHVFS